MKRFSLFAVMTFFSVAMTMGQTNTTGQLIGIVTLSDGSGLAGAKVTVTSPSLQGNRSQVTGQNGDYVIKFLPPGAYTVTFEFAGMRTVTSTATVELGGTARTDVRMDIAGTQEVVTVSGESLDVEKKAVHGATYESERIDALPIGRTLSVIASLAPGLTTNTPNAGQVKIGGAFAFDNLFLIDGVDINDNLFGTATNGLVIEEAVEETQVLTSGITAEYGRFSGGVINAITKSGGNQLKGSFRVDFINDDWRENTPFEDERDIKHPDKTNQIYSASLGGKILTDRLWFFAAGRLFETESQGTLPVTGRTFLGTDQETRYEAKLTANLAQGHSLQAGYTRSDRETFRTTFAFTVEDTGLITPEFPSDLFVGTYSGVLNPNLFASLQYSQKTFQFKNFGGTSSRIQDSPLFTNTLSPFSHFGQPYFDATDPENRDNRQWAGSLNYYLSTAKLGTHDLKIGGEWFTSISHGGNSQSPTGYVFYIDYANDDGAPIYDSTGHLIPSFVGEETLLLNWLPVRGAESNIETKSVFINDLWRVNRHLTANIGFRYEKVDGEGPEGSVVADESSFVPRLGLSYDIMGDGRFSLSGTYGKYAGRFHDGQFNNITNVGNPNLVYYVYVGPDGQGYDYAPGFDLSNYFPVGGNFPKENNFFEDGLSSPITTEWTASAGGQVFRNLSAAVTYVWRDTKQFFEGFTTFDNGSTEVIVGGESFAFDNVIYRNTDDLKREYQAIQFQSTWAITPRWVTQLNYTHMLKYEGNTEGEAANQPGVTSVFGDYPEIYVQDRNFPGGRLSGYQKHKLRFLMNYGLPTRFGTFTLGGIYSFDSGTPYSFIQANQQFSSIQRSRDPGYASPPTLQDIFFSERGSQLFDDIHRVDLAFSYEIPVWKSLSPFFKVSVFNVFNWDELVAHNTSVSACRTVRTGCTAAPVDEHGIPTTFSRGSLFGTARNSNDHQRAREFQISAGIRF